MSLTPREIVNELDKYIIGQSNAKRAVAIALRNRYRRSARVKRHVAQTALHHVTVRKMFGNQVCGYVRCIERDNDAIHFCYLLILGLIVVVDLHLLRERQG